MTDTGMKCFITLANYYGIYADEEHLRHVLSLGNGAVGNEELLRMAKRLKLKAKCIDAGGMELSALPLPAILPFSDGTYGILIRAEQEKCLVLNPLEQAPRVMEVRELKECWGGTLLLFTPRLFENQNIRFGIKWFLPSIFRFKKPLLEVLTAAFVMQLLAVISPLITQSVIDKVLVHRSMSTLDVLAVGLIIITVFETVLSLSRNYVFAHTTSRIDVILSCKVFRHLFHLPLRYFESHRVGDTIARVKELETIRRFLTGLPMSTLLDAVFIVVYLVFMFFLQYKVNTAYHSFAACPGFDFYFGYSRFKRTY